jgi:hypothetical protein
MLFALLVAPRLASRNALVVGGIVYGLAVFVALWFGVVPLVDPVFLKIKAPVFVIAHLAWGRRWRQCWRGSTPCFSDRGTRTFDPWRWRSPGLSGSLSVADLNLHVTPSSLSGDGALLAAGTSTGHLWVWRVADRTPLSQRDALFCFGN